MSCCRRCIKPLKRWAFRQGRMHTRKAAAAAFSKYVLKWLRKRVKLAAHNESPPETLCEIPPAVHAELAAALTAMLAVTRQMRECVYSAVSEPHPDPAALRESVIETIVTVVSGGAEGKPTWALRDVAAQLADFSIGLRVSIGKNAGLDHAKVHEYWLRRIPRIVVTLALAMTLAVAMEEVFFAPAAPREQDRNLSATDAPARSTQFLERLVIALASFVTLLAISLFMVYWRVPDAIHSTCIRSAHDYYTATKRASLVPELKMVRTSSGASPMHKSFGLRTLCLAPSDSNGNGSSARSPSCGARLPTVSRAIGRSPMGYRSRSPIGRHLGSVIVPMEDAIDVILADEREEGTPLTGSQHAGAFA